MSGHARDSIIKAIDITKAKSLSDRKMHSVSIPPDTSHSPTIGLTYVSLGSNNKDELVRNVTALCEKRKYLDKADIWIGIGSLFSSSSMIDAVYFNNSQWTYNREAEKYYSSLHRGQQMHVGVKTGPNERCPCGSGLKYKKCCRE